jgi:TonB family protein
MPLTSAVLKAWADFAISDTGGTRKALVEALNGRLEGASVDLITLVAAENLYTLGIRAGNWQDARDAAIAAVKLAERGQRTTVVQKYRAEIASLAAGIMDQKQRDKYDQLVELDRMLHNEAVQPANASNSNAFWSLHDTARAWRQALESKFPGSKDFPAENDLHGGVEARFPAPASGLPLCKLDGSQTVSELSVARLFQNLPPNGVAAVVIDFAIAADGKVRDPKVLAAVPNAAMNEAVLNAARGWRYKVARGVDPKSCEFARDHYVTAIAYRIPAALQ